MPTKSSAKKSPVKRRTKPTTKGKSTDNTTPLVRVGILLFALLSVTFLVVVWINYPF